MGAVRRAAGLSFALLGCAASVHPSAKEAVDEEFAFVVNPLAPRASSFSSMEPGAGRSALPTRRELSAAPAMEGPVRATMTPVEMEYAALPTMQPLAGDVRGVPLTRRATHPTCGAGMEPRARDAWWLGERAAPRTLVRVEGLAWPFPFLVEHPSRDPNGVLLAPQAWPAEWTTVPVPVAGNPLEVTTYAGTFDPQSSTGTPESASVVRAAEIVPGEVWAFRRCRAACHLDLGDGARVEELALIGPQATWMGSAGATPEARLGDAEPFTALSTRVHPGGSASLMLDYTVESAKGAQRVELSKLDRLEDPFVTVSVMVDVVWPAGEPTPTLTAYHGVFPGRIAPAVASSLSTEPDCVPRPSADKQVDAR
ncbi:MAG: hypothetical protein U0414_40420 [Polyangiaceae bacterium]